MFRPESAPNENLTEDLNKNLPPQLPERDVSHITLVAAKMSTHRGPSQPANEPERR